MCALPSAPPNAMGVGPSPRNSSVALLPERRATDDDNDDERRLTPKPGIRHRLLHFGKKKDNADKPAQRNVQQRQQQQQQQQMPLTRTAMHPVLPLISPPMEADPDSARVYASLAAYPGRGYRSSSPRLHSPASSQIFERNVQENALPGELSPAIPSHIQTEDHIPPVLEASAQAITDDHLTPDEVEIVMHAAHQPAACGIASASASAETMLSSPTIDEVASRPETDDGADGSNYGSLDKDDVHRLSFISFADVVQAEHAETSRDHIHPMSPSSTTANRSPSPVGSPAASSRGLGTSPPTSGAPSMQGVDAKAARLGAVPASPTLSLNAYSPSLGGGELMVETMRQALRKTGSGDLSGAICSSQPMSAASLEPEGSDRSPFR